MNKIGEILGWKGIVKIIKSDGTIRKINNRIMNNALDEVLKVLYNSPANMELAHVAIGDDDTANVDTLTTLYNEIYRVPIITKLKTGTGELESIGILLDTEPPALSGICTIKEIGFFAGNLSQDWNNGDGKDSGLLISRVIVSPAESKTATEQINFTRTDEFARG